MSGPWVLLVLILALGGGAMVVYAGQRLLIPVVVRRPTEGARVSASGVAKVDQEAFPRSILSDEGLVFRKVEVKRWVSIPPSPGSRGGPRFLADFRHEASATFRFQFRDVELIVDPSVARRASTTDEAHVTRLTESKRARVVAGLQALGYDGALDGDDVLVVEESIPAEHRIFIIGSTDGTKGVAGPTYRSASSKLHRGALIGVGSLLGYLVYWGLLASIGVGLIAAAVGIVVDAARG